MTDDVERNDCGFCGLGIHKAVTRDKRAVWIHDEKQGVTEWLNRGGRVHVATPANLKEME